MRPHWQGIDDQYVARGDDQSRSGRRNIDRRPELLRVSFLFHFRADDASHSGGRRHSRTRNSAHQHGRYDIDQRQSARKGPYQGLGKGDQPLGDSAFVHQLSESINKGMAKRAKLSSPVPMRCETVVKAGIKDMLVNMVSTDEMAMLHATGVPMANKVTKLSTNTKMGIYSMNLSFTEIGKFIVDDQDATNGNDQIDQGQRTCRAGEC